MQFMIDLLPHLQGVLAEHPRGRAFDVLDVAGNLTSGHISVIDEDLVKPLDPHSVSLMNSVSWGAFVDPPYEMLIARLPGLHGR